MTDRKRLWARRITDPGHFDREQAALGHAWTLLGFTSDVSREGDWIRAPLGGRSVFVQRFDDGLRGFLNVCAHRFYPLRTEDRGNGPIRCGFHHWQYNMDGVAVGIPKCVEMYGVKPAELNARIQPIEVGTCGGLIFGRLATGDGEPSLETWLGEGYPIVEAMTSVPRGAPESFTTSVAANWKLTCHISLDDYHLVAVHPDTFGKGGYLSRSVVQYHRFGRGHSAYFYGGGEGALSAMAASCREGTYHPDSFRTFHLFPNVTLAQAPAGLGYYAVLQRHEPVAVDRTVLRSWCFPLPIPPADRGLLHGLARRFTAPFLPHIVPRYTRKIAREDNAVCEALQITAGHVEDRPLLAAHEERIGWFDAELERWLGPDAGTGGPSGDASAR